MIYGAGIFGLAALLLWIYCIFDVISTDDTLTRNMPKFVWLLVVIFIPTVGSVAWLVLGRPQKAALSPGATSHYRPPRIGPKAAPKGPDDSPDFLAGLDARTRELKRWEDDLKRREDDLKRQQGDET